MDVSGNTTMARLLHEQAARRPQQPFVVFEDDAGTVTTTTYGAFAGRVNALADALVARGVAPGDKVSLMMTNCTEFLVAWFAINQAGAVMVPVNVLYAADELRYLLNRSDSVGLVAEARFLGVYGQVATDCPRVTVRVVARADAPVAGFDSLERICAAPPREATIVPVAPESPAQIVYTSGTTSRPKGAVISHRSSVTQGIAIAMLFGMTERDRTCVVLPMFHVNAQYVGVVPTLTVGGTIVLLEAFSARRFWQQVREHHCTLMSIVPMLLRTMLAQPPRPDDARHDVRFSFYALPTTSEEWTTFETRFGVRLIEGYGLSETLGICTSNPAVHGVTKRHCIGLPVLGRQVRVVDELQRDLPAGEVGRIMVRGEPLFSGYYQDPAATAACMVDGWLDTGDNGSMDEDGYLYFFDRSKDVIKRAGENIAATEVERVLDEHPKIAESAVIGVPDPLRDEAVKAFVVLRPGETLTADEVQAWCAKHLAKFKVPTEVAFRGPLPRTSIGKIQKFVLKAEDRDARR
jgi:crotonobetaine/carnitine-CoA ligase